MGAYIIRRLLEGIVVIILVSITSFLIMRLLPGDPLDLYIHEHNLQNISPEDRLALEVKYGLDKSLPEQYISWINGIFHGDFGLSWTYNMNVSELIADRILITLHLGILAFLLGGILGPALGVISAVRRGTWIDNLVTVIANVGITTPIFWLGILLIYIFGMKLHWLPVYGYVSPLDDFWQSCRSLILPVTCLALPAISGLARQTRSSTLNVIRQDYIRTAWSKGLEERVIVVKHTVKNAFIPIITMLGMQLGTIIGGAVLIETVFTIPGMGRILTTSVFAKDYQIVQAGALLTAVMVVLCNLAVDISYGWLDPRIHIGKDN